MPPPDLDLDPIKDASPTPAKHYSEVANAFSAHAAEVKHFVQGRVHCAQTAADITQEAFLRFLANPPDTPFKSVRGFLFRVARNVTIDHLRGRYRRRLLDQSLQNLYEVTGETPAAEDALIAADDIARLHAGVAELPTLCRRVFEASRYEGLPHLQIAKCLGVSVSTVEKQMALALRFLRERLQR